MAARVLRALAVCAFFFAGAHAWGQEGHAIIATVAANFISDSTKQVISQFLGSSTMADVASFADDYRETNGGHWSAPLHFINANKGQTTLDMSENCANGICVVNAIYNYTKRFNKDSQSPFACNLNYNQVEPCALVFLIHFVGDVHQPLHCGWGYDYGGNDVKVNWFGTSTNLHAVWDVSIIEKWNSDVTSAANELIQMLQSNNPYSNSTDALTLADESFWWVREEVYDFSSTSLSNPYYEMSLPIVKDRLAAAGFRLAAILDASVGVGRENVKISAPRPMRSILSRAKQA